MTTLYAQPYDISATGFYFDTAEQYAQQAKTARNDFGEPVEEFEIQFIQGEAIDCDLAEAWGLSQCNFVPFLNACAEWRDDQKTAFIVAVRECGHSFDPWTVDPDDFDVEIHPAENMKDLAVQFVEEGLLGDFPERIVNYLDFDAIARDISFDYVEATIAGTRLIYRIV